jgi:hypothetical protein
MNTPTCMLCTTGNRPPYFIVQPCLEHELLTDGLPSHPLDAPIFGPTGECYSYDDNPMHGIVLYAGRVG